MHKVLILRLEDNYSSTRVFTDDCGIEAGSSAVARR